MFMSACECAVCPSVCAYTCVRMCMSVRVCVLTWACVFSTLRARCVRECESPLLMRVGVSVFDVIPACYSPAVSLWNSVSSHISCTSAAQLYISGQIEEQYPRNDTLSVSLFFSRVLLFQPDCTLKMSQMKGY